MKPIMGSIGLGTLVHALLLILGLLLVRFIFQGCRARWTFFRLKAQGIVRDLSPWISSMLT
jgi:hypothetical protein